MTAVILPKRFRLTKSEFASVRRHGRLASGKLMAILILQHPTSSIQLPTSDLQLPKAGLIVSTRLSPQAVVRNLLKRRLRAALQRVLPDLSPGLRLVVLPNRRSLNSSVSELESQLRSLLTI